MYRGQVTAVDAKGVYVLVPSLHPTAAFGPLDHVGARPAVGARVLVADCGDESAPDLVVMTGGLPATSTDNAMARFDGTGGALQNSGVTVDDSNHVDIPGSVYIVKDDMSLWLKASDSNSSYSGMRMTRGELRRWDISKSNWPEETGSGNTGSNLEIARYADDQSFLGRITYWRNTGKLTLDGVGATAGLELGSSGPRDMAGTGSPEGVVTAPKGSTWRRTDGGAGTTFWVKESGSGNTGWVAK